MTDELKPCPNPSCESDDVEATYPERGRSHVFCGVCGMRGPSVKDSEKNTADERAVAAWNALPREVVGPATESLLEDLQRQRTLMDGGQWFFAKVDFDDLDSALAEIGDTATKQEE